VDKKKLIVMRPVLREVSFCTENFNLIPANWAEILKEIAKSKHKDPEWKALKDNPDTKPGRAQAPVTLGRDQAHPFWHELGAIRVPGHRSEPNLYEVCQTPHPNNPQRVFLACFVLWLVQGRQTG